MALMARVPAESCPFRSDIHCSVAPARAEALHVIHHHNSQHTLDEILQKVQIRYASIVCLVLHFLTNLTLQITNTAKEDN